MNLKKPKNPYFLFLDHYAHKKYLIFKSVKISKKIFGNFFSFWTKKMSNFKFNFAFMKYPPNLHFFFGFRPLRCKYVKNL